MLLKRRGLKCSVIVLLLCVLHGQFAACYRSEVEITPAPVEEETTKKSGFFSGFKNFFRGSPSTTPEPSVFDAITPKSVPSSQSPHSSPSTPYTPPVSSGAQKPPPLAIHNAPLMPLGPRPDTPPSSPLAGNQQQPPQWPQAGATSSTAQTQYPQQTPQQYPQNTPQQYPQNRQQFSQNTPQGQAVFGSGGATTAAQRPSAGQPYMSPGFAPYQPPKAQPSGVDLSYGGGGAARPGAAGRPGFGLAPLTSSTSTTTTTPRPASPQQPMEFDLRGSFGTSSTSTPRPQSPREDFPALPAPRRPSTGAKEDFPALPTPRSPSPSPSPDPTPSSPIRPSSPSAWNTPLSTPATPTAQGYPTPASPLRPASPVLSTTTTPSPADGNRVAFVPHSPAAGSSTTVRPGFQSTGNSLATDDEIRTLTENLYQKEVNSQLNLIRVSVQGKTRSIDSTDEAAQHLLEVDPKALESPTIAKMRLLFNNYESDTSTNEYVTPNEHKEENDFVDAVMATSIMRQAMQFLQSKDLVSPDPKTHRELVKELWFTQYSRGGGRIGSSGFEHVFVNEVKNGTIIGLHNWVYFFEEEQAGRLDYKGYMSELDMGNKGKVLKARFTHNGLNKPVNTLFIGTSPELELALYTVCFKLRPDRTCPVSLGNAKFGIVTYSWRYRGKSLIGSAYPEI